LHVDIWVADDSRDQLLRAPYLAGRDDDGGLNWQRGDLVDEPRAYDALGSAWSGPTPILRGLRARPGRATTERWTLTWTGRWFEVRGTSSGLQSSVALPGTPYETDGGELAFTVAMDGASVERGFRLELDTDAQIEQADAGGLVMDLLTSSASDASVDPDWVFAAVLPDEGPGWISVWDAVDFVELERLELPEGAAPERLSPGRDEGVVWIADSADLPNGGRVFRLDFVPGDQETLAVSEVLVPEPAIDVVEVRSTDQPRLAVAGAYSDSLWLLDGLTYEPLDSNPWTESVDPTPMGALISGLAAGSRAMGTALLDGDGSAAEGDAFGTRIPADSLFVTTFDGYLHWIDGLTGCHVSRTAPGGRSGDPVFTDNTPASNPQLAYDEEGNRYVTVHGCGGVAFSESWVFTYEEDLQSYEVEGSRSGVQATRAQEGVRYVSDTGAISVLILPGTQPTTDGDRFSFEVLDNVSPLAVGELPGDPLVFTELYDDRSGTWWKVKEREIVLVPNVSNDMVVWLDVEGLWVDIFSEVPSGRRYYR
ncbi:MAG TPA: hypothetical protein DIU15_12870, partial [Deltaproteobacteria bacterium]|nr:hypothetical protein [Deltaproteobacteria bacterium]